MMTPSTLTPVPPSSKSIFDLLHERPTNWEVIQKRLDTDSSTELPKDLVAQSFLASSPGPPLHVIVRLLEVAGDSVGYYGFGCTKAEFLKRGVNHHYTDAIARDLKFLMDPDEDEDESSNLFLTLSLTSAKALIESFCEIRFIGESATEHVFVDFVHDSRQNKWHFFKTILEALSRNFHVPSKRVSRHPRVRNATRLATFSSSCWNAWAT